MTRKNTSKAKAEAELTAEMDRPVDDSASSIETQASGTAETTDEIAPANEAMSESDTGENVDARSDAAETEEYKPGQMSGEYSEALKGLKGEYKYSGAPLHFSCRSNKDHSLFPGEIYEITKLPKHELIANAIIQKTLVLVDSETKEA